MITLRTAAFSLGVITLLGTQPFYGPSASRRADTPPKRAHHAIVYDEANGRVLLTGGSTPLDGGARFEFYNDLWSFDGKSWRPLDSSGEGRSGQRLAFDTKQGAVLSFGGFDGAARADLLRLNGERWDSVGALDGRPTAEGGFVYDRKRDRFVLFGGAGRRGQTHGDTWELAGTTWQRIDVAGPSERQAFAMEYDSRRERTILFGGFGASPATASAETWEYDGISWSRVADGPGPRISPGSAFDSKRGLFVIFGGMTASGFAGDTWGWDGRLWRKLADTGPAPRAMGYMTYDVKRDRIVLFGGRKGWPDGDLNDTWEWDGSAWTRVAEATSDE